jgi:hypothetical protein
MLRRQDILKFVGQESGFGFSATKWLGKALVVIGPSLSYPTRVPKLGLRVLDSQ